MEYTFLADQFVWLQEQKHPPKKKQDEFGDDIEGSTGEILWALHGMPCTQTGRYQTTQSQAAGCDQQLHIAGVAWLSEGVVSIQSQIGTIEVVKAQ